MKGVHTELGLLELPRAKLLDPICGVQHGCEDDTDDSDWYDQTLYADEDDKYYLMIKGKGDIPVGLLGHIQLDGEEVMLPVEKCQIALWVAPLFHGEEKKVLMEQFRRMACMYLEDEKDWESDMMSCAICTAYGAAISLP